MRQVGEVCDLGGDNTPVIPRNDISFWKTVRLVAFELEITKSLP